MLLNFIILPFRPKKSAHAYQSIWTADGSPLLVNSRKLTAQAQKTLGENYKVVLGNRYGKPSIAQAMGELTDCAELLVLPLFPQYSLAATQTAIDEALSCAKPYWPIEKIKIIKEFYNAPGFIAAQAKQIATALKTIQPEKIIFSYHGLPVRQIKKISACSSSCDQQFPLSSAETALLFDQPPSRVLQRAPLCRDLTTECPIITDSNVNCYRAQCYATTRALAQVLELTEKQFVTTFQSRLGRTPWIQPFTDEMLVTLAKQGIKNIAIACPSFVCDCLETLEEIGIRAREQWLSLGGEQLTLIPCINDDANWVAKLIKSN
jgi:ferrochelatase